MRISVVGSHGTGKTTLCKKLASKYELNYIPDIVPEAFRRGFEINEDTPPETQFWILSKQLELERNTPEPWIMEKSLWDNVVYGRFSIRDSKVLSVIEDIVTNNAKYDVVFYLPIEFPIEDDGLRSLDPKFQKEIDKKLRVYLKSNKVVFHELGGNIEARIKKASLILKNCGL
jgi:nicotinamide riboside kinase